MGQGRRAPAEAAEDLRVDPPGLHEDPPIENLNIRVSGDIAWATFTRKYATVPHTGEVPMQRTTSASWKGMTANGRSRSSAFWIPVLVAQTHG